MPETKNESRVEGYRLRMHYACQFDESGPASYTEQYACLDKDLLLFSYNNKNPSIVASTSTFL